MNLKVVKLNWGTKIFLIDSIDFNFCKYDTNALIYILNIDYLANLLSMEQKYLIELLNYYEAIFYKNNNYYYFDTRENAEKFFNSPQLEPYLVMRKLLGGNT